MEATETSSVDRAPPDLTETEAMSMKSGTDPVSEPVTTQVSSARVSSFTTVGKLIPFPDKQPEINMVEQAKEPSETRKSLASELVEKINLDQQGAQQSSAGQEINITPGSTLVIPVELELEKEIPTETLEEGQKSAAVIPKVEITEDNTKPNKEEVKNPHSKRPQRQGVKRKTYSLIESESEEEEEAVIKIEIKDEIMDKNRLNCVMCDSHFTDLIDLESHVRGHDEVLHFSLILKSPVSDIYCRVPVKWGLQQTTLDPGSDETRARDPLVR